MRNHIPLISIDDDVYCCVYALVEIMKGYKCDIVDFTSNRKIVQDLALDLDWQFPTLTEEGYPKPQSASTSRVSNAKGKAKVKVPTQKKKTKPQIGCRSLRAREKAIVVKKPKSLVKVTNAILGLRALKADVECASKKKKS
ncbi:hypothetical protein Tco_0802320 [Tanacetum coccineum]|uniref:Uncharacterized protein n=1 Tax=Tanacetum coccineum TaxID=301880 RepID=A0ABQ5A2N5_9ASTR